MQEHPKDQDVRHDDAGGWISGPSVTTITWGTIAEVFEALERDGFHRGDDVHVGRAIGMISELAKVYSGRDES